MKAQRIEVLNNHQYCGLDDLRARELNGIRFKGKDSKELTDEEMNEMFEHIKAKGFCNQHNLIVPKFAKIICSQTPKEEALGTYTVHLSDLLTFDHCGEFHIHAREMERGEEIEDGEELFYEIISFIEECESCKGKGCFICDNKGTREWKARQCGSCGKILPEYDLQWINDRYNIPYKKACSTCSPKVEAEIADYVFDPSTGEYLEPEDAY